VKTKTYIEERTEIFNSSRDMASTKREASKETRADLDQRKKGFERPKPPGGRFDRFLNNARYTVQFLLYSKLYTLSQRSDQFITVTGTFGNAKGNC
jgi:hypothetical protein